MFNFSHDARVKAVGRGPVLRLQITLTIVTACQRCRAFSQFRQCGHSRRNDTNAASVLFDGALAVGAGVWTDGDG